ncbi:MAG: histidine phosphatase family protein [Acidimicrobiia bacterium]|nr:histidine phosphatase family protein [Acidimicrobiia bacterium]
MDLILVRHAQPQWIVDGLADNDPRLSQLGRFQADRLHKPSRAWDLTELWTSTLRRATETAVPLATTAGARPAAHAWLDELRPPSSWHGSPAQLVEQAFAESRTRDPDDWWDGIAGGESVRNFHDRVWSGMERALADRGVRRSNTHRQLWDIAEPGATIAIVAHGGTNALLLGLLLGLEIVPWEWERFALAHAGITKVSSVQIGTAFSFSLRTFGDTSHLDPAHVTY